MNPKVLIQPDYEKKFYLETDASNEGVGVCLVKKLMEY